MDVLPAAAEHSAALAPPREGAAGAQTAGPSALQELHEPQEPNHPQKPPPRRIPMFRVPRRAEPLEPHELHPTLWFGHQLGRQAEAACPSGFPILDAELPGGGWPRRALSELLLRHSGIGEMRLLAPCLARVQRSERLVMLFDPPAALSAAALQGLGLDVEQLLVISTRTPALPSGDSLWALEQALKSGHVGAVLAWLPPRLRAERLRRLQLAAHAHDGPAFMLRESGAAERPTVAPLRLALRAQGADALAVRVLKRRGPALDRPLQLALPPVLNASARERARLAPTAGGAGLRGATFVNLAGQR